MGVRTCTVYVHILLQKKKISTFFVRRVTSFFQLYKLKVRYCASQTREAREGKQGFIRAFAGLGQARLLWAAKGIYIPSPQRDAQLLKHGLGSGQTSS